MMKFAYYPGCSADGSGIEYGLSMERTAKILGFELQELEDWNCCGATSGHNTDQLLSLALPARNLAIAEKTGLSMMAPCAACYSRHRHAEHAIQHDPEMKKKIEQVLDMELQGTSETVSILDVLANKIGPDAIAAKVTNPLTTMKAASYYGCLLVRPVEHTGFDDTEDPQSMDQVMKALGADAVYIGSAALIAMGCNLCQKCYTGKCNWGICTQDPRLAGRLNTEIASQRLSNLIHAWSHEISEMLGGMGINALESLRGNRDHLRGIGLYEWELDVLGIKGAGE